MGLGALLLVERQRQENAERERAALRQAPARAAIPDGFERDATRRAIIGALAGRFSGQLFMALQNGLPSLGDEALYELFCEVAEPPKAEPEPEQPDEASQPEPSVAEPARAEPPRRRRG